MFKSVVKPNNNFVFSHYEQVFRTRKVLMFIGLFPLVLLGTTTSQNIRYFFNTLYIPSSEYYAKGRSFTANSGTKAAILLKSRFSTAKSRTQAAVLLGMDRCGSFPLLSAPPSLSLLSIWSDHKRSEKIPGAPAWRWGEWIRLTRPSGLHRNSPQELNISSIIGFDQISDPVVTITLRPHIYIYRNTVIDSI